MSNHLSGRMWVPMVSCYGTVDISQIRRVLDILVFQDDSTSSFPDWGLRTAVSALSYALEQQTDQFSGRAGHVLADGGVVELYGGNGRRQTGKPYSRPPDSHGLWARFVITQS